MSILGQLYFGDIRPEEVSNAVEHLKKGLTSPSFKLYNHGRSSHNKKPQSKIKSDLRLGLFAKIRISSYLTLLICRRHFKRRSRLAFSSFWRRQFNEFNKFISGIEHIDFSGRI